MNTKNILIYLALILNITNIQSSPLTIYQASAAEIKDGKLIFDEGDAGFAKAIAHGLFQLKMPTEMQDLITQGDKFANLFWQPFHNDADDIYRGYATRTGDFGWSVNGYAADEQNQVERWNLERSKWHIFPDKIREFGEAMNALAAITLDNIYTKLNIPVALRNSLSGGALSNNGRHTLMFNHFRPQLETRGLKEHQDWGNITILISRSPGLEAKIEETWMQVQPPRDGYFLVNCGIALETATQNLPTPVTAPLHRVVKQAQTSGPDRTSIALFFDAGIDIRKYNPKTESTEIVYPDMPSFVAAMQERTYKGEMFK